MTVGRLRPLLLAFALAAVLLFFAFRGVDWGELLGSLSRAQPGPLALVWLCFSCSMVLRGLRWRLLLGAERWLPPQTIFFGIAVGYIGNGFLPARAGELLRTAMIARVSGLGVGYVLATALTERILDAVGLVMISLLVVATLENVAEWVLVTTRAMAFVGVVGLVGLLVLPRFEPLVVAVLERLPVSQFVRGRLIDLAGRFLMGLRAVRSPTRAAGFYGLTAAIWTIDAFAAVSCGAALGLSLGLREAMLLLAALGLSSAAPSTPGFIGIYQFVAVTLLPGFGFSQAEALAYILALQASIYLVIVPWGLLGLWRLSRA